MNQTAHQKKKPKQLHHIEITQWNPIPFSSHVQKHDLLDWGLEGHLHFLIEMRTTSQRCSHMMCIPLQDTGACNSG